MIDGGFASAPNMTIAATIAAGRIHRRRPTRLSARRYSSLRPHVAASARPTNGKYMRWSFITSASGMMLEVGANAMKNHRIPKLIGLSKALRDVINAIMTIAKMKAQPAKNRQFIVFGKSVQSESALKSFGTKYMAK